MYVNLGNYADAKKFFVENGFRIHDACVHGKTPFEIATLDHNGGLFFSRPWPGIRDEQIRLGRVADSYLEKLRSFEGATRFLEDRESMVRGYGWLYGKPISSGTLTHYGGFEFSHKWPGNREGQKRLRRALSVHMHYLLGTTQIEEAECIVLQRV